jgi:hypothetical protein
LPNHIERCGGGGVVGAKVEDAANEGKDRTGKRGAGTAMADAFATDPILLVGEGEVNRSGMGDIKDGTGRGGQLPGAVVEHDVLQPKGGTAGVFVGREGILARPAKKEEPDERDVTDGLGPRGDGVTVQVVDQVQRGGLNS